MVMTDAVVGLGAAPSEGGADHWAEVKESMVQMAKAISQLKKDVGTLKSKSIMFQVAGPKAVVKPGKGKGLNKGNREDNLEMSITPGKDSILGRGGGLPKPVFTKATLKTSSLSSSSSSSSSSQNSTKGKVDGKACMVVTMYPAAWSTYLMPVGTKSNSVSILGGTKGSTTAHTKVPIHPVPAFMGAEGNNVQLWIKKVKLHGTQSGWDTATLLAQASAALEGTAALWLHTTSPEVMFQFKQFKAELTKAFTPFTCVKLFKDY
jgi:hypothetical protein